MISGYLSREYIHNMSPNGGNIVFRLSEIQSDEKFGLRTKFNASVGYQYPDIKDGPDID